MALVPAGICKPLLVAVVAALVWIAARAVLPVPMLVLIVVWRADVLSADVFRFVPALAVTEPPLFCIGALSAVFVAAMAVARSVSVFGPLPKIASSVETVPVPEFGTPALSVTVWRFAANASPGASAISKARTILRMSKS
jgi:hypothetical protein